MIQVALTPGTEERIRRMQAFPQQINSAIGRGLRLGVLYAAGEIQRLRLTGKGPFPPAEHRLGNVSFRLMKSLQANRAVGPARENSDGASVTIGTNVEYAAIHEFGGTIHKKERAGSVRLRTDASGALQRQSGTRLAMFAKTKGKGAHKRFTTRHFMAKAHDIHIPARAPIQTGLNDATPQITKEIAIEVKRLWEGKQ